MPFSLLFISRFISSFSYIPFLCIYLLLATVYICMSILYACVCVCDSGAQMLEQKPTMQNALVQADSTNTAYTMANNNISVLSLLLLLVLLLLFGRVVERLPSSGEWITYRCSQCSMHFFSPSHIFFASRHCQREYKVNTDRELIHNKTLFVSFLTCTAAMIPWMRPHAHTHTQTPRRCFAH